DVPGLRARDQRAGGGKLIRVDIKISHRIGARGKCDVNLCKQLQLLFTFALSNMSFGRRKAFFNKIK
ncbi:MAG: hypothetical protein PHR86_01465, partial [Desulfobacterales bacterium]|nr:hypothetical protein [Desulfobacterales bacterium]